MAQKATSADGKRASRPPVPAKSWQPPTAANIGSARLSTPAQVLPTTAPRNTASKQPRKVVYMNVVGATMTSLGTFVSFALMLVMLALDLSNATKAPFSPHFSFFVALTQPSTHPLGVEDSTLAGSLPMPWAWYLYQTLLFVSACAWLAYVIYVLVQAADATLSSAVEQNTAMASARTQIPIAVILASVAYLFMIRQELLLAAVTCGVLFAWTCTSLYFADITFTSIPSDDITRFSGNLQVSWWQFLVAFCIPAMYNAAAYLTMIVCAVAHISTRRTTDSAHYGFVGPVLASSIFTCALTGVACALEPFVRVEDGRTRLTINGRAKIIAAVFVYNFWNGVYLISCICNASLGTAVLATFTEGMRHALKWLPVGLLLLQASVFTLFVILCLVHAKLFNVVSWNTMLRN